ncbi:MAG TPA: dephospho-CoA kinase [Candidatus Acidoferrales bacterium]|nr:dephospho-CoA kinase [Candidatus Acidoferrales bacterium]
MPDPVKTIGLTGGIGSGKSTVAKILAECGALVIHADTVGHEMYRPQSDGWRQVVQAFGADVLATDQSVDRKKLGAIVFADPQALKRLNAIVHPLIFAAIRDQIRAHRTAGRAQPIVVEAALLIEANWLPLVEEVWLVVAGKQAVIARVTAERGLAPRDVESRINAQLSDDARRRYAQVVIENTGSLETLRARVRTAWARSLGDVA